MAKRVLLLGVRADLLEGVMRELRGEGVEFLDGTGVRDVEPAFRQADIDHVVIGGGLGPADPPERFPEEVESLGRAPQRSYIHERRCEWEVARRTGRLCRAGRSRPHRTGP